MSAFGGKADIPSTSLDVRYCPKADIDQRPPDRFQFPGLTLRCQFRARGRQMRRRGFFAVVGGAVAWPLAVRAQQAAMPVVGFLGTTTPVRWPEGVYNRLATLAADLVRRQVAVIAAVGGEPSALAAKAATATIPIVFSIGRDPVKFGLVANLNRPGGNITGVNFLQSELGAKRLGLLHELLPKASTIGMLVNPTFADAEDYVRDAKEA